MKVDRIGQSLQERNFPEGDCFGCGPRNTAGLRIKSFEQDDGSVVAQWTPLPEHSNGVGAVCGGILSTALDCHASSAVALALSKDAGGSVWGVTKEFTIEFLRPTPLETLELVARVIECRRRSAKVEVTASARGEECVRFRGVFVVPRN